MRAIRRDVGKDFAITTHTVVCSGIFAELCFVPRVVLPEESGVDKKRELPCRLRSEAVPSTFAFGPAPTTPVRQCRIDRLAVGANRAKEMVERKEAKRRSRKYDCSRY